LRFYLKSFYPIKPEIGAASCSELLNETPLETKMPQEDLKEMKVISPNKVEVKLPESFVIIDNKNLFSRIFSSEAKSSGGEISDLLYLPEEAKAIVTYKSELVAERVVKIYEVTYIDHKFFVKPYYETVTIANVSKTNEEKKYELVKPLRRNSYLSIILRDRNQTWKNRLHELIRKENATPTIDDDGNLKIVSNSKIKTPFQEWKRKFDLILSNYFNEFHMEEIRYERDQYQDIVHMMEKIEEIRKLYLIDYLNNLNTPCIFLIGRKEHFEDFYQRNESFKKYSKLFKSEFKSTFNSNDSSVVIKSFNIPKLQNDDGVYNKNEIINMILPKIKSMFDVQEYTFNIDKSLIEFYGPKKNVDEAISLLKHNLTKIKCKPILFNFNILNDDLFKFILTQIGNGLNPILNGMLEKDEAVKNLFFKLHVKMNTNFGGDSKNNNLVQIFLTYYSDFKEINSPTDAVYNQINKVINDSLLIREINISKYASFILSSKWKQFEEENLNAKANGNSFFYALCNNQNGVIKILLAGEKKQTNEMKTKIESYLANNEFKIKTIQISEDSVIII
jgi:hypothetical protein